MSGEGATLAGTDWGGGNCISGPSGGNCDGIVGFFRGGTAVPVLTPGIPFAESEGATLAREAGALCSSIKIDRIGRAGTISKAMSGCCPGREIAKPEFF